MNTPVGVFKPAQHSAAEWRNTSEVRLSKPSCIHSPSPNPLGPVATQGIKMRVGPKIYLCLLGHVRSLATCHVFSCTSRIICCTLDDYLTMKQYGQVRITEYLHRDPAAWYLRGIAAGPYSCRYIPVHRGKGQRILLINMMSKYCLVMLVVSFCP